MKKTLQGVLRNGKVVTIPDNILELKQKSHGAMATLINKIVLLVQYLWLRIKLISKSYRMRFQRAIKEILNAYHERTKQIYLLATKSINHQGKISHLKKSIQEAETELLIKNNLLEELNKKKKNNIKCHSQVLEYTLQLKALSQMSCFTTQYWTTRKTQMHSIFNEIVKLDKNFFDENDPDLFDPSFIEYYQKRYALNAPLPTGIVNDIIKIDRDIKILNEEIQRITTQINDLNLELPKEEEENQAAIEKLESITKIPEYIPIIDDEESALLGETLPLTTIEEPKPQRSASYLQMIKDVKYRTGCRDLCYLWVVLLNNDKDLDQHIKSWQCDENGNFTLELDRTLKFWIDTFDRKGGCIFLFGDNTHHSIKGTLHNSHIKIDQGLDSHCIQKIALVNKKISPSMKGIRFENMHCIKMSATCLGITGENIDSFSNMKQTWKKKVSVIPDDYPGGYSAYLDDKFKQAK
jgi:hypothetical protein